MKRATPCVTENLLIWVQDGTEHRVTVGTPAWFDWLGRTDVFSFRDAAGTFTARKECGQRGAAYWRAYRKHEGKLHHVYLGKDDRLTLDRLVWAARRLSQWESPQPSQDQPLHRDMPSPGPAPSAPSNVIKAREPVAPDHTAQHHSISPIYTDPLLATKVTIPILRSGIVSRSHLIERLNQRRDDRLILLSAPAGFGKTTLLAEWITQHQLQAAWVSLDAGDNDPVRLWRSILTAIELAQPGVGTPAWAMLQGPQPPHVEALIISCLNALTSREQNTLLVLDDYHVITSQVVHDSMLFLLDRLPPTLHVAIASRTDPPLPVSHLRAGDQMTALRASDLRFTPDEVRLFLTQVMCLSLPAEALATLAACTEGWIAVLHLAALSLRDQEDVPSFLQAFSHGAHRSLVDYLIEEVLSGQAEEVQAFLQQTAVLERLSGPLCEAVAGLASRDTGQTMLEWLDRANLLLVPLDAERRWYRYHHLFAEFLRERLRRTHPEQISGLHQRAAEWYEAHEYTEEAIHHALAAADFVRAARLIERSAESLEMHGETHTLLRWLEGMPETEMQARPSLCLVHARLLTRIGQADTAEVRLQQAEREVNASDVGGADSAGSTDEEGVAARSLTGEIAAIRGEITAAQADFPRAILLYEEALDHLPAEKALVRAEVTMGLGVLYSVTGDLARGIQAFRGARAISEQTGNIHGALESMFSQASLQMTLGQLHEAAATFEHALQLAAQQRDGIPVVASFSYAGMGKVLYEWNDLEGAADLLVKGSTLNEGWGDITVWLRCYGTLARIKHAQGKYDEAQAFIEKIEQLGLGRTSPLPQRMALLVATTAAQLWLAQGRIEKAVRWAQASGLSVDDPLSYTREFAHTTLAHVLVTQGRLDQALPFLERLYAAAQASGRVERAILILVRQGLALQAQGDTGPALDVLATGLALAEPGGYVRTFLDEGEPMLALLAKLARGWHKHRPDGGHDLPTLGYIQQLLIASGQLTAAKGEESRRVIGSQAASNLLSNREAEILRLVAAGNSNAEIARELVLELSTVKWHLKNIYDKVAVHSRTQVLARARELGLL